jgi:hypothetical protein
MQQQADAESTTAAKKPFCTIRDRQVEEWGIGD